MIILSKVYKEIIQCPPVPPERGGIIGMKNGIVCTCFHDHNIAQTNKAIYVPNVDLLNSKIQQWHNADISFGGMFHSHPINQPKLSSDDIAYIESIFRAIPVKKLFFPIVLPNVALISFQAIRQENTVYIQEDKITII